MRVPFCDGLMHVFRRDGKLRNYLGENVVSEEVQIICGPLIFCQVWRRESKKVPSSPTTAAAKEAVKAVARHV